MPRERLSSVRFMPLCLVERLDRGVSKAAAMVDSGDWKEVVIDCRVRVVFTPLSGESEIFMMPLQVHPKTHEEVAVAFVRDGKVIMKGEAELADQSDDKAQQRQLDLVSGLG